MSDQKYQLLSPAEDTSSVNAPRPRRAEKKQEFANWQDAQASLNKKKEDRRLYKEEIAAEVDELVANTPKHSFTRLMEQSRPERCLLIWATVALFLSSILSLLLPAVIGIIIDVISTDPDNYGVQTQQLLRLCQALGIDPTSRNDCVPDSMSPIL